MHIHTCTRHADKQGRAHLRVTGVNVDALMRSDIRGHMPAPSLCYLAWPSLAVLPSVSVSVTLDSVPSGRSLCGQESLLMLKQARATAPAAKGPFP